MNKFFTTLITLVVVSLAIPASADECVPRTEQTVEYDSDRDTPGAWDTAFTTAGSPPELAQGDEDGHRQFYVDNDECQLDGCGFSIWVYEESNGIAGLQRDDSVSGPQPCEGVKGDTIHF